MKAIHLWLLLLLTLLTCLIADEKLFNPGKFLRHDKFIFAVQRVSMAPYLANASLNLRKCAYFNDRFAG
ncbi:hypothetical protein [Spirosoma sp. KNUC1025]|uniref:hypothetical protein n=1 Tax=Spirosoma sp. KNUC1025 TaxID=2894082 RepID=UPI00386367CA|nr:hypothetical protein LN737_12090 [Spirosoma sp. KNUC1025]